MGLQDTQSVKSPAPVNPLKVFLAPVISGCLILTALFIAHHFTKLESPESRRALVRSFPATSIGVLEPITIEKEPIYLTDGGTIVWEFKDATGQYFGAQWDGQVFWEDKSMIDHGVIVWGRAKLQDKAWEVAHLIESEPLRIRGSKEVALYGVLMRWVEQHPGNDDYNALGYDAFREKYRRDIGMSLLPRFIGLVKMFDERFQNVRVDWVTK